MSDHRCVVRGRADEGPRDVAATPNAVASEHHETMDCRRNERFEHLAPISLTSVELMLLPVAHRISA
jgi:hypothetical protein